MKIEGRIFKGKQLLHHAVIESKIRSDKFSQMLEDCLLQYCKLVDVSPPLWLEANTHDFVRFHCTLFFEDQFLEEVKFDRMQINYIEEE